MALEVGGPGDLSVNDVALAGVDQARKELDIRVEHLVARPGEPVAAKQARLRELARRGLNPIVGVGPGYAGPMRVVAGEFPDTGFLALDPDDCADLGANILAACFADEQAAFMAGAAAALESRSGTVAAVPSANPLLWAGFQAGARRARPDIEVLSASPADAIRHGADVLFAAAGPDAIRAAAAAGRSAIGLDLDHYLHPATADAKAAVLTSLVRRTDLVVSLFLIRTGRRSALTGTQRYDLVNGGVAYTRSSGRIEDIRAGLDALKADIIDGRITVPGRSLSRRGR
jgi:basic membrane protein A